jgi:hypothetical protein
MQRGMLGDVTENTHLSFDPYEHVKTSEQVDFLTSHHLQLQANRQARVAYALYVNFKKSPMTGYMLAQYIDHIYKGSTGTRVSKIYERFLETRPSSYPTSLIAKEGDQLVHIRELDPTTENSDADDEAVEV